MFPVPGLEDAQLQTDQRGGAQNMNDLAAERGRTDNNRTHVAKISAIWHPRVASGQHGTEAPLDDARRVDSAMPRADKRVPL